MNLFIAGADLVCVFFLAIILLAMLFSKSKTEKAYRYFILSVFSLLIFCTSDCISYLMDEFGGNDTVHFCSNLFSYTGVDIILPAFVYYLSEKIRETGSFSRIHARIILAASAVDLWLMVYGAFSGSLFYIENQHIVYGPLTSYVGIIQFIVSIYFLTQLFLNKKLLDKKLVYTVALYFVLPLLALIVEFVVPEVAFAYMSTAIAFLIVYIVVVREDIRSRVLSEKIMYKASITDDLTGMLNRRAYEEEIAHLNDTYPDDFVYMTLDVNGLKKVNDSIGHAAGDELILGAAQCIKKSFGPYGKVFRTGGDEFAAILYVQSEQFSRVIAGFDEEIARWHGKLVDSLAISFGFVKAEEMKGVSIHEVSVLADKRMYAAKAIFYKQKGIDRRGQFEAHVALCNLYTKILKINITNDTYQIINMFASEQSPETGFANSISAWLIGFGKSGYVHPDDLEEYLSMVSLDYMREYFRQAKNSHSVFYRRKYGDVYKKVMMEIIPAGDYTDYNQSLFLYVKDIDK